MLRFCLSNGDGGSGGVRFLFSGGEVQDVCAVWWSKAGFFRRLLEGRFSGLRGKGMAVFGGGARGRVRAVFLEVRAGKGEGGFSGSEGGGCFWCV